MAEAGSTLRRFPTDEGDYRLGHFAGGHQVGHLFLLAAADFTEHHDRFGFRISLEEFDHLRVGETDNNVSADVDEGCSPNSLLS